MADDTISGKGGNDNLFGMAALITKVYLLNILNGIVAIENRIDYCLPVTEY